LSISSLIISLWQKDELLWAAAWLFKATNEDYYMNYIVTKVASMDNNRLSVKEFSWDNKYAGLEVLLVTVHLAHN